MGALSSRSEHSAQLASFAGHTATYTTDVHLDGTVVQAYADIYQGWAGRFYLSEGPCDGTPTSTAVPATGTTVPCNCIDDVVVTQGLHIVGNSIKATFHNNSTECSYLIGVASYDDVDGNIEDQVLFDYQQYTIAPGETVELSAELPPCRWQTDAFCGEVINSFHGGVRYGPRLKDDLLGGSYCATSTPTTQVSNTPTDTLPPHQPR